jgi:hypothetical protein
LILNACKENNNEHKDEKFQLEKVEFVMYDTPNPVMVVFEFSWENATPEMQNLIEGNTEELNAIILYDFLQYDSLNVFNNRKTYIKFREDSTGSIWYQDLSFNEYEKMQLSIMQLLVLRKARIEIIDPDGYHFTIKSCLYRE